jgi:hypothetical protein
MVPQAMNDLMKGTREATMPTTMVKKADMVETRGRASVKEAQTITGETTMNAATGRAGRVRKTTDVKGHLEAMVAGAIIHGDATTGMRMVVVTIVEHRAGKREEGGGEATAHGTATKAGATAVRDMVATEVMETLTIVQDMDPKTAIADFRGVDTQNTETAAGHLPATMISQAAHAHVTAPVPATDTQRVKQEPRAVGVALLQGTLLRTATAQPEGVKTTGDSNY